MDKFGLRMRVANRVNRCDWGEFCQLAEAYGFTLVLGKGSRRRFVHGSGLVVSAHEPHPTKRPVHPEAVKALLRSIHLLEDQ